MSGISPQNMALVGRWYGIDAWDGFLWSIAIKVKDQELWDDVSCCHISPKHSKTKLDNFTFCGAYGIPDPSCWLCEPWCNSIAVGKHNLFGGLNPRFWTIRNHIATRSHSIPRHQKYDVPIVSRWFYAGTSGLRTSSGYNPWFSHCW